MSHIDSADTHELSLEQRSETSIEDVGLDMSTQLAQDGVERLRPNHGSLGIIDRYREGRMGVEVFGRLYSVEVDTPYWSAFFERASKDRQSGSRCIGRLPPHLASIENTYDNQQEPMLVDIIEDFEQPQWFPVWSLVRLAFVKCREDLGIFNLRQKVTEWDGLTTLLVEGRIADGKFSLIGGSPSIEYYQLISKMVESRSQVKKNLANYHAPFRNDEREWLNPKHMLSCLRIDLSPEMMTVGTKPPIDRFLQIGQVFLRSIDL